MIAVRSLQEYRAMISAKKAEIGHFVKNSVQMSSTMDQYIAEHRLFARTFRDGIIFFVDEGPFFNVYYYWDSAGELPDLREGKPLIVEELGIEGKMEKELAEKGRRLLRSGFSLYRRNLLMERPAALPFDPPCLPPGFRITRAGEEELPYALALWDRFLDPEDVPLDHRSLRDGGALALVRDGAGKVCAVYRWSTQGRRSEGRHIVTVPEHLREGLASALLAEWIRDAAGHGCETATTWVNDRNRASLALYESCGFRNTGKYCLQFKKDEKGA